DGLQHRPHVVHVRRAVLHIDTQSVEALTGHHLRREPMGHGEPAHRHALSVAPHLLDSVRSHCVTSSGKYARAREELTTSPGALQGQGESTARSLARYTWA